MNEITRFFRNRKIDITIPDFPSFADLAKAAGDWAAGIDPIPAAEFCVIAYPPALVYTSSTHNTRVIVQKYAASFYAFPLHRGAQAVTPEHATKQQDKLLEEIKAVFKIYEEYDGWAQMDFSVRPENGFPVATGYHNMGRTM